jgi:hypothetical protein
VVAEFTYIKRVNAIDRADPRFDGHHRGIGIFPPEDTRGACGAIGGFGERGAPKERPRLGRLFRSPRFPWHILAIRIRFHSTNLRSLHNRDCGAGTPRPNRPASDH